MEDKNLKAIVERINGSENPRAVFNALVILALFRKLSPDAQDKVVSFARSMIEHETDET